MPGIIKFSQPLGEGKKVEEASRRVVLSPGCAVGFEKKNR